MNKCSDCGKITRFNLSFCPDCLKHKWEISKGFIKPKHNPFFLPWALPKYRSVVTSEFVTDTPLFINTIISNGDFYFDSKHHNISCVLHQSLGTVAGSAIPANYPNPTYPLDSIYIADVTNHPHAFAYDYSTIAMKISAGDLTRLK